MATAQELAEATLIVLKRIFKWLLLGCVFIAVIIAVTLQILKWWEYQTTGKHAEKVIIKAFSAKDGGCDNDYPYTYTIKNSSDKTVEKTDFTLEIRKLGYSNKINSYTNIEDFKILKPNESLRGCFRAQSSDYKTNLTEKEVDITVSYKSIEFMK